MKWNDVVGFEGLYLVSDTGEVITKYNRNGKHGRTLKQYKDKDGYYCVRLYKAKKGFWKRINRLVAEAFIPNPKKLPCVNHIDCNRTNNNVENLEWCTWGENVQHSAKLGRYKGNQCKKVCLINKFGLIVPFDSIQEASRMTNIPASNICKCCEGERKTAGGFQWQYLIEMEC